jgi:hypothetical protein
MFLNFAFDRRSAESVFVEKSGYRFFDGLEIGVANFVRWRAGALVIFAAGMHVANHAVFVDDEAHRGVFAMSAIEPPTLEGLPIGVIGHGKRKLIPSGGSLDASKIPVASGLRMEDAYDLKTLCAVFVLEFAKRRCGGCTQFAGVGPPAKEQDPALETSNFQRLGIYPVNKIQSRGGSPDKLLTLARGAGDSERREH